MRDLLPELGDGKVPDPADPRRRIAYIPRPKDEAVVVGIPGELLLLRPDVQAAESAMRSQSAQIGIAEAQMYPHIGVNGSIGLAASELSRLFNSQSWTGSIGPSLTWNILQYGRLLANVRIQDLQYQVTVLNYQNSILTANQDAENAVVAYLQSLEQAKNLRDSADAAEKLTIYLYKQQREGSLIGVADTGAFINQLFTAVNFQVSQQDAAAQAEGNVALNLILLYRALGGGWEIRLGDGQHPGASGGPNGFCLPDAPSASKQAAPLEGLPPPRRAELEGPVLVEPGAAKGG
jgi:outer membrane protein TolC